MTESATTTRAGRLTVARTRVRVLAQQAAEQTERGRRAGEKAWRTVGTPVLGTITGAGRAVIVTTVAVWVLAWRFGWVEMAVLAMAGIALVGICALFMIGTTRLEVSTMVEPLRVSAGDPMTGEISVRNVSKAPSIALRMELPVGEGGVAFDLPIMTPGRTHSEVFVVPTSRRSVIAVGPATSLRGDPVGLFRRVLAWTEPVEAFVHPRIVALEPLGAGLIRDLEGRSSNITSNSDLSFHALREYNAGDDLRHVHWRSSAKHGTLLVRQFIDTRRSHLVAVVDSRPTSYRNEDDYENAMAAAASLIVRGLQDGYDVSFLSEQVLMTRQVGRAALDACSRAEPKNSDLVGVARRAANVAEDASVALVITGPHPEFIEVQRAASQFPIDTAQIAIRVDSESRSGVRTTGDLTVLTMSNLDDLGGLMRWRVS